MRHFLTFFILLQVTWIFGQGARMFSDQDTIALGGNWEVKLYIEGIEKNDILYIDWRSFEEFQCPVNDTISVDMDVEMISSGKFTGEDLFWSSTEIQLDTLRENTYTNTFEIQAWEHFDCPFDGPIIMLQDSSVIRSGPLPVAFLDSPISYGFDPLMMGAPIQEIVDSSALVRAPIVDIFRIEQSFWKNWIWYIVAGLAITVFLFYLLRNKKEKEIEGQIEENEEEVIPKIPPHILALEKLEQLKNEKIWVNEKDKIFVTQLTNIIREYIEDRFEIPALEQTSTEIIQEMNVILTKDEMDKLTQTMNISDLIKFAKAKASDTMYIQFIDDAVELVNSTKIQKQESE